MFILSLTYKVEISEVEQHIEDHIAYLEKFYASGKFIVSGRKVPRTGGVILVNVSDKKEVEKIIKEDPFYIAEVASYDVIEFIPTMTSPAFKNLISKEWGH